ncbi:MAG: FecR domain-containing protein [Cyclobacteriaceae bacterium]
MFPHKFQELLEKYSRGACTPEEEQFVIDWYNKIGQQENASLPEEEKVRVEEKLWSAINPNPVQKRNLLPFLKRAAVVTIPLLVIAGFFLQREYISTLIKPALKDAFISDEFEKRVYNEDQIPRRVMLSDGSEVLLQPESEIIISISDDIKESSREVRLKGEAFFSVKRDPAKPFIVYTNEVITKVLGTSFNIRAYESDPEITVAVKTGKVSVYAKKGSRSDQNQGLQSEEVILTPNQQLVYHREREVVVKQLVEKPEIILPDSNLFRMQFENADVGEIFEVLEENYGIEIRYDKVLLNNCKLTTSMSDEGLYERIEVICKAIGASYTIDDDAVITIKSNGC